MHRGTTPTHIFTIPHILANIDIENIYITYMQNNNVILEKSLNDNVTRDKCKVIVTLTQEETLLFTENVTAYAQVRIKTVFGNALASQQAPIKINPIIKDGLI